MGSGSWTEVDNQGQELVLEAKALREGFQQLIVLELMSSTYRDLTVRYQRLNEDHFSQVQEDKKLLSRINAMFKEESGLDQLAYIDELTGLYNRRAFFLLSEQQFRASQRTNNPLMLFFFDMNNLKIINDIHGHQQGDEAIKTFARAVQTSFRDSDIVARISGDEFVALAVDTETDITQRIWQTIQEKLTMHNEHENSRFPLAASVGTAPFDPAAPQSLEILLDEADSKMYQHKKSQARAKRQIIKKTSGNVKQMRRLLGKLREKKLFIEGRMLNIDWGKSVYLLSSKFFDDLLAYYDETKDGFALQEKNNNWYLFDVRLFVDDKQADTAAPELATVLRSSNHRIF